MSTYTASQAAETLFNEGFDWDDVGVVLEEFTNTLNPSEYDDDAGEWLVTEDGVDVMRGMLNSGAAQASRVSHAARILYSAGVPVEPPKPRRRHYT